MTICKKCIRDNEVFWETSHWSKIVACITNSKGKHHSLDDYPSVIYETGCSWHINGELHRISKPAITNTDGECWLLNNEYHREDGPAIIRETGDKVWYRHGLIHRLDGPAVENITGHKEWLQHGKYHRVDGPAVEYENGTKHWYLNGELHRLEEPAIIYANGSKAWYLNGKEPFIIKDQRIIIGRQVAIQDDVAIVLKRINKNIFIALLGSQKIYIKTTFFTKYRAFFKKCLTFLAEMI